MKRIIYRLCESVVFVLTFINYPQHYWYMLIAYIAGAFSYMVWEHFIEEPDEKIHSRTT